MLFLRFATLVIGLALSLRAQTTVTLGDGQTNTTAYALSGSNSPLTLTLAGQFYTATQSGLISGSGSVIKEGAGTIVLSAANTYAGGTTLNNGALGLGADNALGTGTLTISGGAIRAVGAERTLTNDVIFNGSFILGRLTNFAGPISLANDVTIYNGNPDFNPGYTSTLSGVISGNHGIVFDQGANPTGFIVLSGANTYTGNTTLYLVNLKLANALALQNSTLDFQDGTLSFGTLTSATFGGLNGVKPLALTSTSGAVALTVGGNNNNTAYSGVLSGAGSLTKAGTGTLTLSGANTYSGGTTFNGGVVAFSSLANLGSGALTFGGGALQWSSGNTADVSSLGLTLGSGGGTVNTNGNNVTFASALSGSGALTKSGAGTLTLAGTNTYSGGTTINAGSVVFSSLSNLGSGALTLNGGTVQWSSGNTADVSSPGLSLGSGGGTFNTNGNNITFASAVSGSGSLVKSGSGTLTLSGANTYAGGTTISAGTVQIGSGGTSGSISGNVVDNAALVFNRSDALTFAGAISGTGSLTQSGGGTLTLSSTNTYSGGTMLNAGILGLGADNALGSGTLTINGGNLRAVGSGRTLTNNVILNGDFTLGRATNLAGAISLTRNVTITSGNPDAQGPTFTSTLSGIISGAYGLTFADGTNPIGTIVLSGANTHSGNTTLQSGNLTVSNSLALQNSTFNYSGGSLGFGSLTSATFGGLAGSQSIALANASVAALALTVGSNNASTTYSGALSGSGSLTKNGTGTLTLSGANTHSGGTTINGGFVEFASASNLGTGTLTLSGGGLKWSSGNTADVTALSFFNRTLGSAGSTFDTNGNNVIFANVLSGSGSLTKTGSGTLTLNAANTYTGNTTVSGGTLALAGGNDRLATTGTLYLTGGAMLDPGGNAQTFAGLGSASSRLVGNIASGTIATTGNSYLQSGSYANTWTGSSATGRLWIGGNTAATVTLNGTNDAVYTADHNQVIIGYPSITGAAGTVKLGNANALAAATENVQVFSGTLDLNGQTNVRANSIALASGSSSKLVNNSSSTASYAGPVTLDGAQVGGSGNLTLSGALSGGSFEKTGYGTLTLSNDNFFAGSGSSQQVTLTDGTLSLGSGAATFDFGDYLNTGTGAAFTFSNGTLKFATPGNTTVTGGFYSDNNGYAESLFGGMRFDTAGQNVTLSNAAIYGTALAKTGAGTLTLADTGSGYYVYSNTFINEGTLALTKSGQLGNSGLTLGVDGMSTSGTLNLGGTTQTLSSGAETNVYSGSLTNGTLATDGQIYVWGSATLNGTFTGSGSSARLWINAGSGDTVYLGGSNDRVFTTDHNQVIIGYSGSPNVKLLSATALAAATENVEVWTATLDFNGQTGVRANSIQMKSGASSSLINSSASEASYASAIGVASAGSVVGGSGNLTLSGVISGSGGLNKTGAGTLTLSGANTYSGATAINAGRVDLTGSAANSAFTINSGGTLSGTGTLGALTVASGGILAPGASPGTLSAGNTTWAGGGRYAWEVNNAAGTAGASWDLLSISGTLTLTATNANPFTLSLVSLTAGNSAGAVVNFNASQNSNYTIASASGGILGFDSTAFTINTTGFANSLNGTWSLGVSGNQLDLNYTASAIPEPSTYAAMAGMAMLGFAVWRKRQAGKCAVRSGSRS